MKPVDGCIDLSESARGCSFPWLPDWRWGGGRFALMDWEGGRGNSSHYKGTFAERDPWAAWWRGLPGAGCDCLGCADLTCIGQERLSWAGLVVWVGCTGSGSTDLPWCDPRLSLVWPAWSPIQDVHSWSRNSHIHVVDSDSSELVAAVALTGWNCSHPSCHSASKNNSSVPSDRATKCLEAQFFGYG